MRRLLWSAAVGSYEPDHQSRPALPYRTHCGRGGVSAGPQSAALRQKLATLPDGGKGRALALYERRGVVPLFLWTEILLQSLRDLN